MASGKYLTDKQESFVQALIRGETQRKAYREAYPASRKWKDSVVDSKASTLLANGKVKERYEELRARLIKETEDETIASAKEVLQLLTMISRGNIKNYTRFGTKKMPLMVEGQPLLIDGKPLMSDYPFVEILDSDEVNGALISEISQTQHGIKIKLYDKLKAAELLGKHHGLFEEKVEVRHTYTLQLPDELSPDE